MQRPICFCFRYICGGLFLTLAHPRFSPLAADCCGPAITAYGALDTINEKSSSWVLAASTTPKRRAVRGLRKIVGSLDPVSPLHFGFLWSSYDCIWFSEHYNYKQKIFKLSAGFLHNASIKDWGTVLREILGSVDPVSQLHVGLLWSSYDCIWFPGQYKLEILSGLLAASSTTPIYKKKRAGRRLRKILGSVDSCLSITFLDLHWTNRGADDHSPTRQMRVEFRLGE
jgi:hypothetical protein